MTPPLCPACLGTRVMGDKHPRPCTCCEDGHMRGIDDPTPEERRIAELEQRLAETERVLELVRAEARHHELRAEEAETELFIVEARAESDRLEGGA